MLSALAVAGMRGTVSTSRLSALAAVANSLSKVIEGSDLEARSRPSRTARRLWDEA